MITKLYISTPMQKLQNIQFLHSEYLKKHNKSKKKQKILSKQVKKKQTINQKNKKTDKKISGTCWNNIQMGVCIWQTWEPMQEDLHLGGGAKHSLFFYEEHAPQEALRLKIQIKTECAQTSDNQIHL